MLTISMALTMVMPMLGMAMAAMAARMMAILVMPIKGVVDYDRDKACDYDGDCGGGIYDSGDGDPCDDDHGDRGAMTAATATMIMMKEAYAVKRETLSIS